jgi:hypothetical protein
MGSHQDAIVEVDRAGLVGFFDLIQLSDRYEDIIC